MIFADLFLIGLALTWIIGAVIQDLRKREVSNWWNFSLVAVALAYRALLSIFYRDYRFFIFGLGGFVVFFLFANLFYYSRIFAGGDAKLLMGVGAIIPFSFSIFESLQLLFYFLVLMLFLGSFYGVLYSIDLVFRNMKGFKKEFLVYFKKYNTLFYFCLILSILLFCVVLILREYLLILFSLVILLFPILLVYAKSIEESCMIRELPAGELSEGDWLYQEIRVGKRKIKPNWQGLSNKELKLLKNYRRKIKIKEGIPFTPAFLFAFVCLILFFL